MPSIQDIRRAVHVLFNEATERSLRLMLRYPECEREARGFVRDGNTCMANLLSQLDEPPERSSSEIARIWEKAESESLDLMRQIQHKMEQAQAMREKQQLP
ncbi:MAG: hypothetical protein ACKVJH_05080 [Flavobacteriales bacterium]